MLKEILKNRILLLDGAMGTMIQAYHLGEDDYRGQEFSNHPKDQKGNNDLLTLTRPDIIKTIHAKYLEAGSDIIETNTFNSNAISMLDYGMEALVYRMNFESSRLAKEACLEVTTDDKPRFVAGALGPTNKTASMSPDVNRPEFREVGFDDLVKAYTPQIEGLVDGKADIILIETLFDTLNAKAALLVIYRVFKSRNTKLPIMVSGTLVDASVRHWSV